MGRRTERAVLVVAAITVIASGSITALTLANGEPPWRSSAPGGPPAAVSAPPTAQAVAARRASRPTATAATILRELGVRCAAGARRRVGSFCTP